LQARPGEQRKNAVNAMMSDDDEKIVNRFAFRVQKN